MLHGRGELMRLREAGAIFEGWSNDDMTCQCHIGAIEFFMR